MKFKNIIIRFLLVGLLSIFLLNVLFYSQQPSMVFYPSAELKSTPNDWGMDFENIALTTTDSVRLHGWYLPVKESKQALLFFHGNGGNISHRGESLKIFHSLGLNVLIIDYRGYGKSDGVMSEQGFYLDAMSAWQYLTAKRGFKPENIVIFGRSLGGAVATQLATQVDEKALIVESTFSSVNDMVSMVMPLISKFIYLRYSFNTEKIINQVKSPILLMHSQDDEVVPYELGEKVFAAAKSPKYFFELYGGHNDGFMQNVNEYRQTLNWFITEGGS